MTFDLWLKTFNNLDSLSNKIIFLSLLENGVVLDVREVGREEVIDCFDIINSIVKRKNNMCAAE
jgi:hypothetical protein